MDPQHLLGTVALSDPSSLDQSSKQIFHFHVYNGDPERLLWLRLIPVHWSGSPSKSK